MGGCVLVVEDEPLIRLDAVTMLEEAGLTVVEFDGASEAADYVRGHAADVAALFTDVNLRGAMDGIDLARVVAHEAPSAVLLVTSGRYCSRPAHLPAEVRFLRKPWLPLDVLNTLQDAVARH